MNEQSGAASHLPGALVVIQEAGRHFGKIGKVIGRRIHDKMQSAYVRTTVQSRKGKWGSVVVVLPDAELTRTPDSLALPSPRPTRLGAFLSKVAASPEIVTFPKRRRLSATEYARRQSVQKLADMSRKRNRKA